MGCDTCCCPLLHSCPGSLDAAKSSCSHAVCSLTLAGLPSLLVKCPQVLLSHFLFRCMFCPWTNSEAGLVSCLEPQEVVPRCYCSILCLKSLQRLLILAIREACVTDGAISGVDRTERTVQLAKNIRNIGLRDSAEVCATWWWPCFRQ